MDIVRVRPRTASKPVILLIAFVLLGACGFAWMFLARANGSATKYVVDGSTIISDVARLGSIRDTVSGAGIFVPLRARIIATGQAGVVESISIKPGNFVTAGSAVAVLSNPQISADLLAAQDALRVSRANLASLRQESRAAVFSQVASLRDAEEQHKLDALQSQSVKSLHASGYVSDVEYRKSIIGELRSANTVADRKIQVDAARASASAKEAASVAQVDQAGALVDTINERRRQLKIRSGLTGIVLNVDVDPGASLMPNATIARIADPTEMIARLQIPETDVHRLRPGMHVSLNTGGGSAAGHLVQVSPTAQGGAVSVDVSLDAPIREARPLGSVEGQIAVSNAKSGISTIRPINALENAELYVYKLSPSRDRALRVMSRTGRISNDRIEFVSGVSAGDNIIVSDTSKYPDRSEIIVR